MPESPLHQMAKRYGDKQMGNVYEEWIGRRQTKDTASIAPLRSLTATLDHPATQWLPVAPTRRIVDLPDFLRAKSLLSSLHQIDQFFYVDIR